MNDEPERGGCATTNRATCVSSPVAAMTRLKINPPPKLATAPRASEPATSVPGPRASRASGSVRSKSQIHAPSTSAYSAPTIAPYTTCPTNEPKSVPARAVA